MQKETQVKLETGEEINNDTLVGELYEIRTVDSWAGQGSACGCHAVNIAQPVIFCPLHAAAPDLYEALNLVLPMADQFAQANSKAPEWRRFCGNKAAAAIAKAEGRKLNE